MLELYTRDFWLEVFYYFSEKLPSLKIYATSEVAVSHNVLYYQQLSKIYVTSEVAVSHNVLYYQQLSHARYQVSSCVNICFEYVPSL